MNLTARVRAIVLGPHTHVSFWTGPRTGTKTNNGKLIFREAEWKHFKSLLVQNSDTREMLVEVISLCETILPTIVDENAFECELCGAPNDEPCEDDCLAGRARGLMALAQEVLWRRENDGLLLEEEE